MANRAPRILLAFLALAVVSSCNGPSDSELAHRFGGSPASAQGGTKYSAGTGIAITGAVISATANPSLLFGDGSDGACVLDGSTACLGMTPSAGVYTNNLGRELFFTNLTINSGITFKPAGYPVHASGTLTFIDATSLIANNGGNADGTGIGGAASQAGLFGAGGFGGNGGNNSTPAAGGGNSGHVPREFAIGSSAGGTNNVGANGGVGEGGGGGGIAGAGASGSSTGTTSLQSTRDLFVAIQGHAVGDSNALTGGTGGGGGRGDGFTGIGGGGGGGGGWNVVEARVVAGPGLIQARGGAGANGVSADGGGGGGGGGGVAVLVTSSSTIPTVDANGGAGGGHAGAGFNGGSGGNGIAVVYKGI